MESFCRSSFWIFNITWNADNKDALPACENTLLVWIPAGFIFLFSFLQLCSSNTNSKQDRIPLSTIGLCQHLIVLLLITIHLTQYLVTFRWISDSDDMAIRVDQAEVGIKCITYSLTLALQIYTKRKGTQRAAFLIIFWFMASVCNFFEFESTLRNLHQSQAYSERRLYQIFTLASYSFVVGAFILQLFVDKVPKVSQINGEGRFASSEKPVKKEVGIEIQMTECK